MNTVITRQPEPDRDHTTERMFDTCQKTAPTTGLREGSGDRQVNNSRSGMNSWSRQRQCYERPN